MTYHGYDHGIDCTPKLEKLEKKEIWTQSHKQPRQNLLPGFS